MRLRELPHCYDKDYLPTGTIAMDIWDKKSSFEILFMCLSIPAGYVPSDMKHLIHEHHYETKAYLEVIQ